MTRDARTARNAATATAAAATAAESSDILASIGLVPYDWRLDTDTLAWGANAAEVLHVPDLARIATGRGYAAFLDGRPYTVRQRTGGLLCAANEESWRLLRDTLVGDLAEAA